jgi:FKBP-type peptidyl-prolyl cis-trans isomerase
MIITRAFFANALATVAVALLACAGPSLRAEDALKIGQKFLKENGAKRGVRTTPSGLQYEVIREGVGRFPGPTDTVEVNYRGTSIEGKEFDSSYKRKKSISFRLDRVIKGWTEGLQLMKEGATYRFFIPSELAYGAEGSGTSIAPNETLIFEVQLLAVK